MKAFFGLFFFLFVVNGSLKAQVAELEWGIDNKRKATLLDLYPDKGFNFYTYRITGNGLLQANRVSRYMYGEEVLNKKIENKVENLTVTLESLLTFNGTLLGFFSDKRDGEHQLYMVKYDTEIDPYDQPILMAEFPTPKLGSSKGYFMVQKSKNDNFLCVEYVIPAKKDNFDRYGFHIIDTNYKTVKQGEYEVPFSSRYSTVNVRHVTNDGEFVLGVTVYNSSNRGLFRDYSAIEKAVILHVQKDTLMQYEMFLDQRRVFDFEITSRDSLIVVTGTYGEQFAPGAQGVFYQRININQRKVEATKVQPFPQWFLDDLKSKTIRYDRMRSGNPRGVLDIVNYAFRDVHQLEDGSLVIVAEQYYVYQQTTNDSRGMIQTVNHYYYDDALIYQISPQGDFNWISSIPKEQHSTNDYGYYSSLKSIISNGKCLVFFNDHRKNYDDYGVFKRFNYSVTFPVRKKTYALALSEITLSNGDQKRTVFNDYSQTGGTVSLKMCANNPKYNELLFFSSGKKERFGLLKY